MLAAPKRNKHRPLPGQDRVPAISARLSTLGRIAAASCVPAAAPQTSHGCLAGSGRASPGKPGAHSTHPVDACKFSTLGTPRIPRGARPMCRESRRLAGLVRASNSAGARHQHVSHRPARGSGVSSEQSGASAQPHLGRPQCSAAASVCGSASDTSGHGWCVRCWRRLFRTAYMTP